MLYASLVLAADEEASGVDLLLPDFRELGAAIIAFGIVFFFIWKYAIPAFNEILEKRQAAVKSSLEAAEAAKDEAESLREDYRQQLAGARDEAGRLVEEARQAGEVARADIVAKAQEEASDLKERTAGELDAERSRVAGQLRSQVAGLSLDVAEKVVGRSLDRAAQQQLVDEFIDELGGVEN
jgi:F-type H+-transporting ATPase subunit b